MQACTKMSMELRAAFTARAAQIAPRAGAIRDWIPGVSSGAPGRRRSSSWARTTAATRPGSRRSRATVHAFEPDPRNHPAPRPNVVLTRAAVAAYDGRTPFVLSRARGGP